MIATYILDEALACIANDASRLDICSEMPKLYADVARLSIGHKSVPAVSSPENCEGGRMVVVASIEDGTVTRAGTPTYWCLTGQSRILVCDLLDPEFPVRVLPGIAFTLPSIRIRLVAAHS